MAKAHLTEITIRSLRPPQSGQVVYWDSNLKAFGCRVSQGGTRTWVVKNAGRLSTIGRWPLLPVAEARTEAKRILYEGMMGKIRPGSMTFDAGLKKFLSAAARRNRSRTVHDYRYLLGRHFLPHFERKQLSSITPQLVADEISRLDNTPGQQNHAFVALRVFFRWCVRQHHIERSPMEGMALPSRSIPRERVLTDDELVAVFKAAQHTPYPYGSIVQLLILTGQRRGEVAALRWDHIDSDTITLPGALTKNRRQHSFPTNQMARVVISEIAPLSDYLFPASRDHVRGKPTTIFNGWQKAKILLDNKCGVANWTLHDLRRTFSSNMAALRVPPHVTEKLLNHSSGIVSGVAATYNRYQYLPEMRDAVSGWNDRLATLLN